MNYLTSLKFPVTIEGSEDELDWTQIATLQTREDFEFRLSSYALPAYPKIRVRDAEGETFEFSQEGLTEFGDQNLAKMRALLRPLNAFTDAAPERALETASELIRGAIASKHFVIPQRARVNLHHPHLHHLRMAEFEDSVVCHVYIEGEMADEECPAVTIWKADHKFTVTPDGLDTSVQAFLVLLCASIVRDFWILENRTRQRTYQTRTEKTRERQGTGKDRKLVVRKDYVFLPRFQYDLSAYQDKPRTVSHAARVTLSPHLVSGHLRNLPEDWKPSEDAKAAAEEFGISLGEGQTFVRPHKRGEIEQLRTYRSRSAFQLIFGEGDTF